MGFFLGFDEAKPKVVIRATTLGFMCEGPIRGVHGCKTSALYPFGRGMAIQSKHGRGYGKEKEMVFGLGE